MGYSIFRASLWVAAGVALSRLFGFAREVILASYLGVSVEADMAAAIARIPDLITLLVIGSAFSAVLVPAFGKLGDAERYGLFRWSTRYSFLVFLGLVLLLLPFTPTLAAWSVAAITPESLPLLATAIGVALFAVPFLSVGGVQQAWLHHHGNFAVPSLSWLAVNGVVVTSLLLAPNEMILYALAAGLAGGAMLRALLLRLTAARYTKRYNEARMPEAWRPYAWQYTHAMVGGGTVLLLPIFAAFIAGYAQAGGLAAFNYAHKLLMVPLQMGIAPLAVALLPNLSQHIGAGEHGQAERILRRALLLTLLVALVAMGCTLLLALPVTQLIYGYGEMNGENVQLVALILQAMAFSLPAQALHTLLLTYLHALGKLKAIWVIGLAVTLLYLAMAFTVGSALSLEMHALLFSAAMGLVALAEVLYLQCVCKVAIVRLKR